MKRVIRNPLSVYDSKKCIFFALGRNAMYAACKALKLKEGDEVLTPAFDCDGSLQPFRVLKLNLRFFRTDPHNFYVDIKDIKKKITPNTKLVHIINHFGFSQDWNTLATLREKTGIPILEDSAYSLFSKFGGRELGTFGDLSVFSLRKNITLTDGGLLCINNPEYHLNIPQNNPRWLYPTEYEDFLRVMARKLKVSAILKYLAKLLTVYVEAPPPLYSDAQGFPEWPQRDKIEEKFSCHYLRPISEFAAGELSKFSIWDLFNISEKKRQYYLWLVDRLKKTKGIEILWPNLPAGTVPFCLCILVERGRDILLEELQVNYEVMAWPTLSAEVLKQLNEFPEVELLGRRLLQINLPTDRVLERGFRGYLENLVRDFSALMKKVN